jgi:UDP-N-acetylglucosamine/UDP-N-acetyl-alpha-D-glucosaminouronate 4-epimerase
MLSPATRYEQVKETLRTSSRKWLITGVGGFVGSHLLETLLKLNQHVVGLDNGSAGQRKNLARVRHSVGDSLWRQFTLHSGDIRSPTTCRKCMRGIDYVLHQAALASVPLSFREPALCNAVNVDGFLNIFLAATDAKVRRIVYASSSAVYGDTPELPKREECIGSCLSPYAVSKRVNELYADVLAPLSGCAAVGLRYFNVFGPRQDPNGPYAAVIPQWVSSMLQNRKVIINGDGKTTRDFCYIDNVVQANLLAATTEPFPFAHRIYNVASGGQTSLTQLFLAIRESLAASGKDVGQSEPVYGPFRQGDIRHSQGDTSRIARELGYEPTCSLVEGISESLPWYQSIGETSPGARPKQAASRTGKAKKGRALKRQLPR